MSSICSSAASSAVEDKAKQPNKLEWVLANLDCPKKDFRTLLEHGTSKNVFLNQGYFAALHDKEIASDARLCLAVRLFELVTEYKSGDEINVKSFIYGVNFLANHLNLRHPKEWTNFLPVVYMFLPRSCNQFLGNYPLEDGVDIRMLSEEHKRLLLPIRDGTAANPQQFDPAVSEELHARQRPPRSNVSAFNPNHSGTTMVETRALTEAKSMTHAALTEAELTKRAGVTKRAALTEAESTQRATDAKLTKLALTEAELTKRAFEVELTKRLKNAAVVEKSKVDLERSKVDSEKSKVDLEKSKVDLETKKIELAILQLTQTPRD